MTDLDFEKMAEAAKEKSVKAKESEAPETRKITQNWTAGPFIFLGISIFVLVTLAIVATLFA